SDVSGAAVLRGSDGNVVGVAGVVAAVVVVEGRNRGHEMGIESVQPGEEDAGIGFVLAVAQTDAGSVLAAGGIVFDVAGERIVRNLEIIAAEGRHKAQLVRGINVIDERTEAADAVHGVVHHLWNRRLQAEIAAVAGEAGVVGKALSVAAEADRVVGLIEIAGAEDKLGLIVAL